MMTDEQVDRLTEQGSISGAIRTLPDIISDIPKFIDKADVEKIITSQISSIDRLETTNKSLMDCSTMAQNKLAVTSKLFKKTAKTLNESKRDLDFIYKKISDLKSKIRTEKPDLCTSEEAKV